jgi:hypothetical protein
MFNHLIEMVGAKGQNTFSLNEGKELKIEVEHEGGFISAIAFKGELATNPPDALVKLALQLKWVQLNPVAIYTRMRFFMLKNKVEIPGIDLNELSKAIASCMNNPV